MTKERKPDRIEPIANRLLGEHFLATRLVLCLAFACSIASIIVGTVLLAAFYDSGKAYVVAGSILITIGALLFIASFLIAFWLFGCILYYGSG